MRKIHLSHITLTFLALLLLLSVGIAGYHFLEGYDFVEALYMTVITIATVGFEEVHPLGPVGRLFTIGLILGGGGVAAYALSVAVEFMVSGEWRRQWMERRKKRMLSDLNNHVIVCGFGRVGRFVVQELKAEGIPFVIIELNAEHAARAEQFGYLVILGNGANEGLLASAGIERAKGLVAAVDSDAENVYITLTARGMAPKLPIIARANFEESESKLLRAGATRVMLPYRLSGRRMVTMLVRPEVSDFLDEVAHAGGMELLLEQVSVEKGSSLDGASLSDARAMNDLEVTVLAIRSPETPKGTRPNGETMLHAGMQLLALGTKEQLLRLMEMAQAK